MPKPLLKHMQPNGVIATRQTNRKYTHVLLVQRNPKAREAEVLARLPADIVKGREAYADSFTHYTKCLQAGAGNPIPYRKDQGGYTVGAERTYPCPEYMIDLAREFLANYPYIEAAMAEGENVAKATAETEIAYIREMSPDARVESWHTRADLAQPYHANTSDVYIIEEINHGVRPADTQWRIAPGDPTYVLVPGVVKPIKCGSQKTAKLIVDAVNAYSGK